MMFSTEFVERQMPPAVRAYRDPSYSRKLVNLCCSNISRSWQLYGYAGSAKTAIKEAWNRWEAKGLGHACPFGADFSIDAELQGAKFSTQFPCGTALHGNLFSWLCVSCWGMHATHSADLPGFRAGHDIDSWCVCVRSKLCD